MFANDIIFFLLLFFFFRAAFILQQDPVSNACLSYIIVICCAIINYSIVSRNAYNVCRSLLSPLARFESSKNLDFPNFTVSRRYCGFFPFSARSFDGVDGKIIKKRASQVKHVAKATSKQATGGQSGIDMQTSGKQRVTMCAGFGSLIERKKKQETRCETYDMRMSY